LLTRLSGYILTLFVVWLTLPVVQSSNINIDTPSGGIASAHSLAAQERSPEAVDAEISGFQVPVSEQNPNQNPQTVQVSDPEANYSFGGELSLGVKIQSPTPIKKVVVFLQAAGNQPAIQGQTILNKNGQYIYIHDLNKEPLRAFAKINYWYGILLENGEIATSQIFSFYYEDNRYTWQTLEFKPFRLHWYEGNLSFAQEIFNTAWDGWVKAKKILPIFPPERVEIYVYASAREVQSTLQMGSQNWVAGHADPDLGVIAVSLPPGPEQRLEMARQIPHELMHIMMYKKLGDAYNKIPIWLNEGLASAVELYPDPNYSLLMQTAYQKKGLLPIANLCQSFPKDASNALLAYAESASFLSFIYQQYGTAGIESLLEQYSNGQSCERGFQNALGHPITKVEQNWLRDSFETSPALSGLENLIPWAAIMAVSLFTSLVVGIRGLIINRRNSQVVYENQ